MPGSFYTHKVMTLPELKEDALALFPIPKVDTFMYITAGNTDTTIDGVLRVAVRKALSRYEKIESMTVYGSGVVSRAASILKCVSSFGVGMGSEAMSVWSTLPIDDMRRLTRIRHYFDPNSKMLKLQPDAAEAVIEYVVDNSVLTIEDLNPLFQDWLVEYACCLLMENESSLGLNGRASDMPFEFDYEGLRTQAGSEKERLLTEYNDMCMGTLALKSN